MKPGQESREARLTEYLEGQLSEDELQALLDDDPVLREALADAESGRNLLKGLEDAPAPPNFLRKVQRRVRRKSAGRYFNPAPYPTKFAPAIEVFAVIAVVIFTAFYLFGQARKIPGPLVEEPPLEAPKIPPAP